MLQLCLACATWRRLSRKGPLHKNHRLDAVNLEPLPAAGILALNDIVSPDHVVPGFGESRPVSFIGVTRKPFLFGSHQPANLVRLRLVTMQAGEGGGL